MWHHLADLCGKSICFLKKIAEDKCICARIRKLLNNFQSMPGPNKHISACTDLSGTDVIFKRISVLIYALILVLDITSEGNDLPIFQKELKLTKLIQGIFSTFRQGRPPPNHIYTYLEVSMCLKGLTS